VPGLNFLSCAGLHVEGKKPELSDRKLTLEDEEFGLKGRHEGKA
jgi:hypothetical protein